MRVRDDPTAQVAELYAAACPRLIGYLTVLTGSPADAEEIAQETFVQALRHWSKTRRYDDPTAVADSDVFHRVAKLSDAATHRFHC